MRDELLKATRSYIDATKKLDRMFGYTGDMTNEKYRVALNAAEYFAEIRKTNKEIMLSMLSDENSTEDEYSEWYEMMEPYIKKKGENK